MSLPMLLPHDYSALFRLATRETDETAPGGQGREGHTVRDLHTDSARRLQASSSFRVLERLGLVERFGRRDDLVVWTTTARGYETVFPS